MQLRSTVPVVALALLVLSGCVAAPAQSPGAPAVSASAGIPLAELDLLADPHSFDGPSTAVLPSTDIDAPGTPPAQQLPATVLSQDRDGETSVTVTSTERILALDIAGSIAATVFGLGFGDSVVGRDTSTTFPEAADLPLITNGGHSINSEAVLALRPTVVITDGTIGPLDVVLQLRDAGIPVVFVSREPSLAGVGDLARSVGAALGAPAAGSALASSLATDIEAKIAEIAAVTPASKLRMVFLYLRGASGIYYLFGSESGADELITSLGGIDVAGEIGWQGMRPLTDEALIAANPDLILVMTDGLASAGGVDGLLAAKPAIGLTTAGQKKRFVDMADGEILSFGPRTAGVLDSLARAVYAPGR